jgi:hypothetical protein
MQKRLRGAIESLQMKSEAKLIRLLLFFASQHRFPEMEILKRTKNKVRAKASRF